MEHERFEGERTLMRIHIGESDRWQGSPLYDALIKLFRREGFSGVTVLRGVAGYGSTAAFIPTRFSACPKTCRSSSKSSSIRSESSTFCPSSMRWWGAGWSRSRKFA